ncbi:Uncharacterised protein [Klebsiella pneumoniae]|nr:Uncharacterised protein [Klebsiella pneumoniae]
MYSNQRETSQILFRKNGVDLLILPERIATLPAPGSVVHIRISKGQVVRHFLSGTTFNLYEGIYRFARSFTREENNYVRFFQAVGSPKCSDRRHATRLASTKRNCRLSIIHTRRDSDSAFSPSFRLIKSLTLSEYRKTMRLKKNELSP